jgi:MYXO-CTERM domain-containing protein
MKVYFAFLIATVIALPASAHPGKTDRDGGHKCYKECAEWDLYYAEYHLHDRDGKPVKLARKRPARSRPAAAPAEEKAAIEEKPSDRPAEATLSQPVAAAAAIEPDTPSLPWILLLLFLLLFLVVRRKRRKASGAEQTEISR